VTVELALLISSDGIALAHRQSAGHWAILKDVSFSDPNLDKAMKSLRKEAEARAGAGFSSLLILPDDQILYTSLTVPTDDAEMTAYRIEEGLEGMTPYAVSELVYDWRAVETDRVKLAVVARETLDEARGFAETHGFKPAGFAAMPPQERFPGVPLFDLSGEAADTTFSDDGIAFGPDTFGQEPEEEATQETPGDAAPETEGGGASETDDPGPGESPIDEADSGAAVSEPATEASDASDAMPADQTAAQAGTEDARDEEEKAEAAPPEPEPEPDPEADALSEAADRDPEEVIAAASDSGPGAPTQETGADDTGYDTGIDATRPPLEDPSLTEPVAPLEETPLEETGTEETGTEETGTEETSTEETEADRLSDAIRATRNASAAMDTGGTAQGATPEFSARTAPLPARDTGDAAGHETAWDTLLADSDDEDAAPAGKNPLAERLSRVRDASKSRPARTAKPMVPPARGSGAVVPPARKGRLSGLTAGPFPGTGETAGTDQKAPQGLGGRLGGLIGRGRNGADVPDKPAPTSTGARAISGTGRLTALGAALRAEPAQPAPQEATQADAPGALAATDAATDSDDTNLTGGLLGRTPDEPTGRSYRTGLLLTIILLILLAAIAVWSALFLPNSPVARLLGGGEEVAAEDPLDAPDAPIAITAPPAIGELATVEAPPGSLLDEAGAPADAPAADPAAEADVVSEDEAAADGIDIAAAPETEPEPPAAPPAEQDAAPAAADVADMADMAEVAPLPPLPLDALPSLEDTEAAYAEYGIWQRPPDRPDLAPIDSLSDLGLSAVDRDVAALDAISLPLPRLDPSETLRRIPSPPPFGTSPARTAAGLVAATPEGVITPDGVLVTAGTPPVQAIPRPREAVLPARTPTFSIEDAILGTFRPEPRPGDLGLAAPQEAQPGQPPITRASLSPQPRALPSSPSAPSTAEQASAASLFPQQDAAVPTDSADSPNGLARSLVPAARPGDMDAIIANAVQPERQEAAPVIETAAVAPGPSIPSNADVARAATQSNQMRLREVNLIGVTGTASDRRALVRLPSGRFVRVGVGDRLNGGRVAAIGASTLQYVRSGRTVTLDIPG